MEMITKDDLRQFGLVLMDDIRKLLSAKEDSEGEEDTIHPEWLKSRMMRKLMYMSAGTLQNLRISGKLRYKKYWVPTTIIKPICKISLMMNSHDSFGFTGLPVIAET